MSKETLTRWVASAWIMALVWPSLGIAQVPVDDNGEPVAASNAADDDIPLLAAEELATLVGPIALYPDDLLAIVLPASTYPLQLVQAERFLQDLKVDPDLEPDETWDDSVVALLNYPEAIKLMTRDLDKTWRLGEAVVAQQADVIAAIESFRDQAYAAGNLQSDSKQTVAENEGIIEITPVEEDVIYVPYYEPEEVIVYQPRPVYYYYPRAYPVYYYPYPYGYRFSYGFFWGVTTAFTVGWLSDSVHVYHHSYYGHPYHGHYYGYNYWYRRPSIQVHNNYYYRNNNYVTNRHGYGDYWQPHSRRTVGHHDQRVTRSRHYPGSNSTRNHRQDAGLARSRSTHRQFADSTQREEPIRFRQRTATTSNQSSSIRPAKVQSGKARETSGRKQDIEFQARPDRSTRQFASNTPAARQESQRASETDRAPATQSARAAQPNRVTQPRRSSERPTQSNRPGKGQLSRSGEAARSSQPGISQPSRSGKSSGSSQPRISQPSRSIKSTRSSQPRVSQPARSSKSTGASRRQHGQSSRSSAPKQHRSKISASGNVASSVRQSKDRGNSRQR